MELTCFRNVSWWYARRALYQKRTSELSGSTSEHAQWTAKRENKADKNILQISMLHWKYQLCSLYLLEALKTAKHVITPNGRKRPTLSRLIMHRYQDSTSGFYHVRPISVKSTIWNDIDTFHQTIGKHNCKWHPRPTGSPRPEVQNVKPDVTSSSFFRSHQTWSFFSLSTPKSQVVPAFLMPLSAMMTVSFRRLFDWLVHYHPASTGR
jgi:hypothetical protein